MTPKQVLEFAKKNKVVMVDFKFIDFPGIWQHFSVPLQELSEATFEEGAGFDGSSIRGWRAIDSSDMLIIPDPSTVMMDPFRKYPTMSLVCNIVDPITKEPYSRDPRFIAQKAEQYLKSTGIGDTAYFGPEAEFFIFDDVRYDQTSNSSYYYVDSVEGIWNSGADEKPNLGYKPRHKEGYFPVPPTDSYEDLRTEMVTIMQACGIEVEAQHHEVATGGQAEIDMRFRPLVEMADKLMLFKYIVKNTARKYNKTVTFMPKPLFAGKKYAGLSDKALYYIGGILKHAPALTALTNPTTNSYKRLVPGFEAPVLLAYSARNRSASIRIPMYSQNPKAKRVEVRFPDPSCNAYLAFSAMLMAGLDGIENKIEPGEPMDKDLYDLPPEELSKIPTVPHALEVALDELEKDHKFLLKGGVFTEDAIQQWISYKRVNEVDALRLRPHPYEFFMYYDI